MTCAHCGTTEHVARRPVKTGKTEHRYHIIAHGCLAAILGVPLSGRYWAMSYTEVALCWQCHERQVVRQEQECL